MARACINDCVLWPARGYTYVCALQIVDEVVKRQIDNVRFADTLHSRCGVRGEHVVNVRTLLPLAAEVREGRLDARHGRRHAIARAHLLR